MPDRQILEPSAAHPITIAATAGRVVVTLGDAVLADSGGALTLREATYPPVQYIPREDAAMAQLRRSTHTTWCPYKGEASYYDVPALGARGANAVWTYETPHAGVAQIAGHLAFYPDRVSIAVQGAAAGAV
ncbi:DUF427 domain-containing protein [Zavarzinia sp. CC-PAN008]|uniref:DUF427 domain-containing protein n=1 Tax=Zavarzinia sp. CC-PAN008 TaxID=3243332 RepID=UPI003F747EA3